MEKAEKLFSDTTELTWSRAPPPFAFNTGAKARATRESLEAYESQTNPRSTPDPTLSKVNRSAGTLFAIHGG